MPDLAGSGAIVTGASSGIGAATAAALVDEGARVVGGARRIENVRAAIALPLASPTPQAASGSWLPQSSAWAAGLTSS